MMMNDERFYQLSTYVNIAEIPTSSVQCLQGILAAALVK
jgi:hypothetical protein